MRDYLARWVAIRHARLKVRLGWPSPEQLDLLLNDVKAFQGDDLADMLTRHPHLTLTDAQWELVLSRDNYLLPVAGVPTLPKDVMLRLAAHPMRAVREEVYLNTAADDEVRQVAAAAGIAKDVKSFARRTARHYGFLQSIGIATRTQR